MEKKPFIPYNKNFLIPPFTYSMMIMHKVTKKFPDLNESGCKEALTHTSATLRNILAKGGIMGITQHLAHNGRLPLREDFQSALHRVKIAQTNVATLREQDAGMERILTYMDGNNSILLIDQNTLLNMYTCIEQGTVGVLASRIIADVPAHPLAINRTSRYLMDATSTLFTTSLQEVGIGVHMFDKRMAQAIVFDVLKQNNVPNYSLLEYQQDKEMFDQKRVAQFQQFDAI